MTWLVDHAATLLNRYGPGVNGKSPIHLLKGKPPSQPIAEFGECVLYRPHKGSRIAGKLTDRLKEGVWLGVNARSGEHFIGTPEGVVRCRDIHRQVADKRWQKDVFTAFRGVPWALEAAQEEACS